MAYVPLNLGDDVQESHPVPAARYDVVITEVEAKEREGKHQLSVSLAIEGHDDAPNLRHFISLPSPGDDSKKAAFKALLLKRFLTLFRIPHTSDGFEIDDMIGARANAELTLDTPDDEKPTEQYNRLQVPRLRDEGEKKPASKRAPPKR